MAHHLEISKFPFKSSLYTSMVQEKLVLKQRYNPGIGFDLLGPRVVFSRYDVSIGRDQIFSGKIDTASDLVNISNSNFSDEAPAVSKLKGKIIFARGSGGYDSKLFIMNTDGTAQAQLTSPPSGTWDHQPAWSRDGKQIAFVRSYQIWIAHSDGSKAQSVMDYTASPGLDHAPSWSPSGAEIAFWREEKGGPSVIKAVNVASKTQRFITTNVGTNAFDGFPSWSPDGTSIAFWRNDVSQSGIWIVDSDGKTSAVNVSKPDSAHGVVDRTPSWSADGSQIVFARTNWVDWNIWIMNLDGSGQNPLFSGTGHVDFYPSWD